MWIRFWAFVGFVAVALATTLIGDFLPTDAAADLWILVAVYGGCNVAFLVAGGARLFSPPGLWIQLVVDAALITSATHLSGGVANPFTGLFILLAATAGILLPTFPARLASVYLALVVAGQGVVEASGLLPPGCLSVYPNLCVVMSPTQLSTWGIAAAALTAGSGLFMAQVSTTLRGTDRALRAANEKLKEEATQLELAQDELQMAQQQLQSVVDCMADAVVFADKKGSVVMHNRAAAALWQGKAHDNLRVCHAENVWNLLMEKLNNPGPNEIHPVLKIGGRAYDASYARVSGPGRELLGAVMVARDVTERLAEQENQRDRERLSTIGRLAATLAHELNNPLCAITLFTKHALRATAADDPIVDHLETVHRNADSCRKIVSDLLEYARQRPPERRAVDPRELIDDAVRTIAPKARECRVDIDVKVMVPDGATLDGDPDQLRQALVNLGLNAIEAMPSGGCLRFAGADGKDSSTIVLTVADDGVGIAADELESVFNAFYTTKTEGTGLGLAVVRDLVRAHGGRVDLTSNVGQGTTFSLTLPRSRA